MKYDSYRLLRMKDDDGCIVSLETTLPAVFVGELDELVDGMVSSNVPVSAGAAFVWDREIMSEISSTT